MKRSLSHAALVLMVLSLTGFAAEGDKGAPDPPAAPGQAADAPVRLESNDKEGLLAAMGKAVVVHGTVVRTNAWEGGITFINLKGHVAAVCFKKNYGNFPEPPDKMCHGKEVEISGTLSEHKGKMQVEITKPEQIKILGPAPAKPGKKEPAPAPAGKEPEGAAP